MPGEGLQQRPSRMTLTNVETGDFITAQFNPDEVKEKLAVNYEDLDIQGLSHKPKQYKNTSNLQITYELGFDVLSAEGNDVQHSRRFLHSLCYARKGASTNVSDGGPPRVLFSWPNLYSLVCVVTLLDFTHKRFNRALLNCLFTCAVTIEEARSVRLFSEDVLNQGTMR